MRPALTVSLFPQAPWTSTKLTTCIRSRRSYVPRFFQPEPEDVSTWDGRPVLSDAGREALERDFKADYGESA